MTRLVSKGDDTAEDLYDSVRGWSQPSLVMVGCEAWGQVPTLSEPQS